MDEKTDVPALMPEHANVLSILIQQLTSGYRDLYTLVDRFHCDTGRNGAALDTLDAVTALEAWGKGQGPMPSPEVVERAYDLFMYTSGGDNFEVTSDAIGLSLQGVKDYVASKHAPHGEWGPGLFTSAAVDVMLRQLREDELSIAHRLHLAGRNWDMTNYRRPMGVLLVRLANARDALPENRKEVTHAND
jgi:hypothetical protein